MRDSRSGRYSCSDYDTHIEVTVSVVLSDTVRGHKLVLHGFPIERVASGYSGGVDLAIWASNFDKQCATGIQTVCESCRAGVHAHVHTEGGSVERGLQ
jgi:hypothetical protein